MPTYVYRCPDCGYKREATHGISETPRMRCRREDCYLCRPSALGHCEMQRIPQAPAIVLKGKGFYRTGG